MAGTPWISVIGIGDDGVAGLSGRARERLDAARLVVGGERHLAMVDGSQRAVRWRRPIAETLRDIEKARPGPVAVLASGDPSWFGVARLFSRFLAEGEAEILPAVSSMQLAAARLGWPIEENRCVSACGRPLEEVWPHLEPGARLLVLSAGAETPAALAHGLRERGFGPSPIWVMAHLGGPEERIWRAGEAHLFHDHGFPALNLVAVECVLEEGARWYSRVAGLPDEAFRTDGTMTKRVLRAAAISALAPRRGEHLWDVGAGSGSISVEWLRAARETSSSAIEPREDRRRLVEANGIRLCVAKLAIVATAAPDCFGGLPDPAAVFFGSGVTEVAVDAAIERLPVGGRLVAHAVTVETQGLVAELHARHGGELMRIAVETAEPLGRFRGWRPAMPVLHWHWVKP